MTSHRVFDRKAKDDSAAEFMSIQDILNKEN